MATFEQDQAAIERRRRIAEQLMNQGAQPMETTQTAGGYVVPVNGLGAIGKIAQQLSGAYIAKQADKSAEELQNQRLEELGGIDFNAPDAANKLMKMGMVAEALKLKTDKQGGAEKIPTGFMPSDDGTIAPMPIAGGGNFMDYQLQLANQKAQIPGYGEAERLQMAKQSQGMDQQRLQMAQESAARQEEAAKLSRLQNIPPTHRMAYAENANALSRIDDAIEQVKKNPNALGLQNILGDNFAQRVDKEGVPVRAAVAEVGGVKLHDLSGAAISPSESKRLMPMVPTSTDNAEAAIAKLLNLRKEYAGINTQIEGMYSGDEYRNPIKPSMKKPEIDIAKEQKKQKVLQIRRKREYGAVMAIKAELHDGTVLEFPDDTSPDVIKSVVKKQITAQIPAASDRSQEQENPVMNAIRGFSARGNQAMNALNPFASQESNDRIAAEQEWVNQHKGAGIGSTLADIAITSPAGAGAGAAIRSLATGAIEGATHGGDLTDKIKEMAYGTLGAGVGEGAANVLGFMAKPFAKQSGAFSDVTDAFRTKAKDIGINLNAAQQTGNKTLQAMDAALDWIPSSSGAQQANKEAQRLAFQKALFKLGGENADVATQEAMAGMKSRIGGVYDDIASRNNINVDQQLKDALDNIADVRNLNTMDANKRPIVEQYLQNFNAGPVGSTFSGQGYQATRSMLDKQAKALTQSNPAEAQALRDIRNAVDEAMGRSVSPADAAALKKANNDYAVMKAIEGATDPTTAAISPAKLINSLATRDKGRVLYGKGSQELNDIAKVGKAFISPAVGDSGTAQRQMMIKMLTGGGVGALGTMAAYNPEQAATTGAASIAAAILLPKAAQRALWKQNGYLSKGLADLTKESVPGLSRQRIIAELMRNVGTQAAEQ